MCCVVRNVLCVILVQFHFQTCLFGICCLRGLFNAPEYHQNYLILILKQNIVIGKYTQSN